ncbi:glycosyltransferase [Patulibacter sp.]|uniref:glycosyltransferase n=1 Tax=Patulibacter sp. TaxID=1912859 RepID=UPI002719738A|nr:glycosyltransferase [Patulibacter sp.]MDO9408194.1 glycosyltransferase [Patulibacter sp.]
MTDVRPRVLFISPDAVGKQMAGLGIRYTELAATLTDIADVVIATGAPERDASVLASGARVVGYEPHAADALREWIAWAHTIVTPPQWPVVTRWLRRSGKRVVFDLYDPETLETLELFSRGRPGIRRLMVALTLDRLHDALRTGHHFMCASEAQRDLWTGVLLGGRALGPKTYDADRSLRSVIDLVPFGLPSTPPTVSGGGGPRAAFPQIAPDDEIVLWNGGIWPWLDAPTAVRAMARVAQARPGVRLVFMGRGSGFAGQAAVEEAQAVARAAGVLDSTVLFSDRWVPYAERSDWLLAADCGIATAGDHLETRYAFRTRMLDCFWAGLPVVCTAGDDLAARVGRDGLGAVSPVGDDESLAMAIVGVLERGRVGHGPALAEAARDYAWPVVSTPLRRWVLGPKPRLSPARTAVRLPGHLGREVAYRAVRASLARLRIDWPSL